MIFKRFLNFILQKILSLMPLLTAFLSEIDVLILSLMGKCFNVAYVVFRLSLSLIVFFIVDVLLKALRKHPEECNDESCS